LVLLQGRQEVFEFEPCCDLEFVEMCHLLAQEVTLLLGLGRAGLCAPDVKRSNVFGRSGMYSMASGDGASSAASDEDMADISSFVYVI
jgi:hypothetical protein